MTPVRTFLDTGVLFAAVRGNHAAHVAARAVIDDPTRKFLLSDLVRLEVMPKAVFNKSAAEAEFYRDVFDAAEVYMTDQQVLAAAYDLAIEFGLAGMDACHAVTAIRLNADEFITAEGPTKPFFRITGTNITFVSIA